MIRDFAELIPAEVRNDSGSVFYSGRNAFSGTKDLYVLGLNPGGSPVGREDETAEWHSKKVIEREADNWSAYRDESWAGKPPGTYSMQSRVLHMFEVLNLDPGEVPCSNLVFPRSSEEATLDGDIDALAELCWAFHRRVIDTLSPKAIACFGGTAGDFVCQKLGANNLIDTYVEQNNREWKSHLYSSDDGLRVAVLTHPSRANWRNAASDPTTLVTKALSD